MCILSIKESDKVYRFKKRLSFILVFIIALMPSSIFADNKETEIKVTCPQIEVHELPYNITTEANINISIDLPNDFSRFNVIGIMWLGGKFKRNLAGSYGEEYPYYRTTDDVLKVKYYGYNDNHIAINVLDEKCKHVDFPIVGDVLEKESYFSIGILGPVNNSKDYSFSKYVYNIPSDNLNQTTTPQAITNNTQNPYPSYNYSNTSSSTSNSDSSSSTSNTSSNSSSPTKNESKDEKKETTIKEESPLKNEETNTSYLSKEDIKAPREKVEYSNIAKDSEEYEMISKLSEKGILTKDSEVFDLKKELSKDESLTYLAKLLVVNDAASSKLDNEVIEKYLDPKDENFAFLATVGSMLEEDTLKTVSEAEEMSRELFAEILNEVTELVVEDSELPFKDIEESPYKEALEYCYEAGLLVGTSKDTMSPSNTITNGQMLQVLSRLDEKLSKEEA